MKFTILTKPITVKETLIFNFKNAIKYLLNTKTYGPKSVIESIKVGLKMLGTNEYNINPKIKNIYDTVFIPIGVETLKSAIQLKKKGLIKTIIAGPNISIPLNKNDIFLNNNIDKIIVPSKWLKDYFLSINPNEKRIHIWSTGVSDTGISNKKSKTVLIYKKKCPKTLFKVITDNLKELNVKYSVIGYGNFNKNTYIKSLDNCIAMIYLQESESQGLALHEAWIKNIPTLVRNRGYWKHKGKTWNDDKISAPYLNSKCGIFFKGKNDFLNSFSIFIKNIKNYNPREYSLNNFTNIKTTNNILKIINK